jgi:hypothetical protein
VRGFFITFNPKYALGMHILPGGLTKTLQRDGFVKVNLDNENHQTVYVTNWGNLVIFIRQIMH